MTALAFPFTKLVVSNLAASEKFYCSVFGFTPTNRNVSTEHIFAQTEVTLRLPDKQIPNALILTHYINRPRPRAGSAWIGLIVATLDETIESVVKAGGNILVESHFNEEHGVTAAIASDPEGHLLELLQILGSPDAQQSRG